MIRLGEANYAIVLCDVWVMNVSTRFEENKDHLFETDGEIDVEIYVKSVPSSLEDYFSRTSTVL